MSVNSGRKGSPASYHCHCVIYVFETAEEFAGMVKADVALFCSHSG